MHQYLYGLAVLFTILMNSCKLSSQSNRVEVDKMEVVDSSLALPDTILLYPNERFELFLRERNINERATFEQVWLPLSKDLVKGSFVQLRNLMLDSVWLCGKKLASVSINEVCFESLLDKQVLKMIADSAFQMYSNGELALEEHEVRTNQILDNRGAYYSTDVLMRERLGCWYCETFEVGFLKTVDGYRVYSFGWIGGDCCR